MVIEDDRTLNELKIEDLKNRLADAQERIKTLNAACVEAVYQLGRIESANWDIHQARLGAKSGLFQLEKILKARG